MVKLTLLPVLLAGSTSTDKTQASLCEARNVHRFSCAKGSGGGDVSSTQLVSSSVCFCELFRYCVLNRLVNVLPAFEPLISMMCLFCRLFVLG